VRPAGVHWPAPAAPPAGAAIGAGAGSAGGAVVVVVGGTVVVVVGGTVVLVVGGRVVVVVAAFDAVVRPFAAVPPGPLLQAAHTMLARSKPDIGPTHPPALAPRGVLTAVSVRFGWTSATAGRWDGQARRRRRQRSARRVDRLFKGGIAADSEGRDSL
jgi:hypothetical protein